MQLATKLKWGSIVPGIVGCYMIIGAFLGIDDACMRNSDCFCKHPKISCRVPLWCSSQLCETPPARWAKLEFHQLPLLPKYDSPLMQQTITALQVFGSVPHDEQAETRFNDWLRAEVEKMQEFSHSCMEAAKSTRNPAQPPEPPPIAAAAPLQPDTSAADSEGSVDASADLDSEPDLDSTAQAPEPEEVPTQPAFQANAHIGRLVIKTDLGRQSSGLIFMIFAIEQDCPLLREAPKTRIEVRNYDFDKGDGQSSLEWLEKTPGGLAATIQMQCGKWGSVPLQESCRRLELPLHIDSSGQLLLYPKVRYQQDPIQHLLVADRNRLLELLASDKGARLATSPSLQAVP